MSSATDPDRDLEAVLAAEAGRLYAIAYSVLHDPEDARDAVQDALERAWQARGHLRDPGRRRQWLTQICVRRCLTLRRRAMRRRAHEACLPPDERLTAASADTFMVDWERSFHRLPLRQRAVVVLHFHCRYSLDDCAALMGCRPGTARQHLARALASLRRESLHD